MKEISPLTYKISAFEEVPNFNQDDCVDWAIEMIRLGFDSPSLLILAGLTKPTNYFESTKYLKDALNELGVPIKNGKSGIISYSTFFVLQISKGINVKSNLGQLYNFCQLKNYESEIYDFYLLHWAWGDLDYGNEFQEYWPDATKENIEQIAIKRASDWLIEHPQ